VGAQRIPYLYEQAFQWYPSFDPLGDVLAHPNPTTAIDYMMRVFDHLVGDCGWPPQRIHLFGFAQGGSVAAEFAQKWWRRTLQLQQQKSDSSTSVQPFGSVVTVGGPLLSYPTLSTLCTTPILVFHRPLTRRAISSKGCSSGFPKRLYEGHRRREKWRGHASLKG
jgi:hypothetical protein